MRQSIMNKCKKFRPSFWEMMMTDVCVMTLQSCIPEHAVKTVICGTLYADSTLTTPLPGDTLVVHDECLGKVGISLTDDSGHLSFSYWHGGVDANPEAKLHKVSRPVFLCYHGDTLWAKECREYFSNTVVYPGLDWNRNSVY